MQGRTLIIEGPEMSGKTTLGAKLDKIYALRTYTHTGGPIKSSEDYQERLQRFLEGPGLYIMDRIPHVSHWVYKAARDWGDSLIDWDAPMADLEALRPVIVYCRPNPDDLPGTEAEWVQAMAGRGHKPEWWARKLWPLRYVIRSRYGLRMDYLRSLGFDVIRYNYRDTHSDLRLYGQLAELAGAY